MSSPEVIVIESDEEMPAAPVGEERVAGAGRVAYPLQPMLPRTPRVPVVVESREVPGDEELAVAVQVAMELEVAEEEAEQVANDTTIAALLQEEEAEDEEDEEDNDEEAEEEEADE